MPNGQTGKNPEWKSTKPSLSSQTTMVTLLIWYRKGDRKIRATRQSNQGWKSSETEEGYLTASSIYMSCRRWGWSTRSTRTASSPLTSTLSVVSLLWLPWNTLSPLPLIPLEALRRKGPILLQFRVNKKTVTMTLEEYIYV